MSSNVYYVFLAVIWQRMDVNVLQDEATLAVPTGIGMFIQVDLELGFGRESLVADVLAGFLNKVPVVVHEG